MRKLTALAGAILAMLLLPVTDALAASTPPGFPLQAALTGRDVTMRVVKDYEIPFMLMMHTPREYMTRELHLETRTLNHVTYYSLDRTQRAQSAAAGVKADWFRTSETPGAAPSVSLFTGPFRVASKLGKVTRTVDGFKVSANFERMGLSAVGTPEDIMDAGLLQKVDYNVKVDFKGRVTRIVGREFQYQSPVPGVRVAHVLYTFKYAPVHVTRPSALRVLTMNQVDGLPALPALTLTAVDTADLSEELAVKAGKPVSLYRLWDAVDMLTLDPSISTVNHNGGIRFTQGTASICVSPSKDGRTALVLSC
jgi:hypothetical protein